MEFCFDVDFYYTCVQFEIIIKLIVNQLDLISERVKHIKIWVILKTSLL